MTASVVRTGGSPASRRRVTPSAHLVLPADASEADWLAARRGGIGSSDIPAVMGVSEYGTARSVYYLKRGELAEDDDAGEPALWGRLHEETVAREWARRNRSVIRRVGVVARVDVPWMMCTLDRRVVECPLNRDVREQCAAEIKTRNAFVSRKWRRGVPDDVLAQVLWQIAVTGYDHIHVAVLIGGNDFRQYTVRRSDYADILADIVTVAADLWDRIETGRPPVLDIAEHPAAVADLLDRLHPDRDGLVAVDPDAAIGALRDYETARLTEQAARRRKETARVRLVELLGTGREALLDGHIAWSLEPTARRVPDLDRLAERHPDAYADCVPDKPGTRLAISKPYRLTPSDLDLES